MVDRALRRTGKSWVTGSDLFGTNSHNRTVIRKNVRLEPSIDDSSSPECIERDVNVLDPPPFFLEMRTPSPYACFFSLADSHGLPRTEQPAVMWRAPLSHLLLQLKTAALGSVLERMLVSDKAGFPMVPLHM